MNAKCTFLLQYFSDRHILLKDEWLYSVVDFLHSRLPSSKSFDDEKFANLVLDQWTCSNIEATSFPVFGNHGIEANTTKQCLQGPIVCQVNSFIDTGSPYYQQYCNLSGSNKKEDNSGFEKVFHEKEDDSDQKPSRLLKLTLTDGESFLSAIEFWKCPQLSLHCRPGTKLLIEPPCNIRKGVFLLKPNNCKILGGEVLPLLSCHFPMDEYARMLKIQDSKPQTVSEKKDPEVVNERTMMPSAPSRINSTPNTSGPSSMISRYFTKKPTSCTPSTSRVQDQREISPDIMANSDEEDNISESDDDFENHRPSTSRDAVLVSSLIRQIQDDKEEFESSRRIQNRSPKIWDSVKTPPSDIVRRRSIGVLTSRKIDPMDEMLETMIEEDEEPISCATKKTTHNPFRVQAQPPLKKVKVEAVSDDDDIQVIELVTPVKKELPEEKVEEDTKHVEESDLNSPDERLALKAFSALKLSSLFDSTKKMKYSIGSRKFTVLSIIEDIVDPLRMLDGVWTMKVMLQDTSGTTEALIDNPTLESLIGYTCEEAIAVQKSSDIEKRRDGKRRLDAVEQQLQRLDLVFEIEFFAGTIKSCPVIRSMKTLAEKIDVY